MYAVWINKNIRAGDTEKFQEMFPLVCSSHYASNYHCPLSLFVPFLWFFLMIQPLPYDIMVCKQ